MEHLHRLLAEMVAATASDLHLKVGAPPLIRVDGTVRTTGAGPLAEAEVEGWVAGLLTGAQRARLDSLREVDLATTDPAGERFRVVAFRQAGTPAFVFRHVLAQPPSLAELALPAVVESLCVPRAGLVVITGATGSGKSTTLAAMVDHINHNNPLAITTLEDPVEILHHDALGHITQREIGLDATSFATGVVEALRQDPDVILIGELRDRETIATAMLAAETGHLVLTTLHTKEATETVQRILATFPDDGRNGARVQLAACLRAVVSQRLIPRAGGAGRVPACEVMVVTDRIRDLIRRDLLHEIPDAIASGRTPYGMQNFDQALAELLAAGTITFDEALAHATRPADFALRYRGIVSGGEEVERGHHAGRPQSRGRG